MDEQEPNWVEEYRRTVGQDPPGWSRGERSYRWWADGAKGFLYTSVTLALVIVVVIIIARW